MADEPVEAYREFMKQLMLRFERLARELHRDTQATHERTEAMYAEIRTSREENRRYFKQLDAKLDDQLAESRAQREALFRMLDKLDGGGAAPATT